MVDRHVDKLKYKLDEANEFRQQALLSAEPDSFYSAKHLLESTQFTTNAFLKTIDNTNTIKHQPKPVPGSHPTARQDSQQHSAPESRTKMAAVEEYEQRIKKQAESEQMFKTLQSLQDDQYSKKVKQMKSRGEARDSLKLDQMQMDSQQQTLLAKWQGTGLEDEIFYEYMKPKAKRPEPISSRNLEIPETRELKKQDREPLYPKGGSYVTMDGVIQYDDSIQMAQPAPFKKQNLNNKFQSLTRFFQLKQAARQTSAINAIIASKQSASDIKMLSKNHLSIIQTDFKKPIKSQNLSIFGQKQEALQKQIPLVKEWFQSLDVQDRVLCLTSIDAQIVSHLKQMCLMSAKVTNQSQAKFKMVTRLADQHRLYEDAKVEHHFSLCNGMAYRSTPEEMEAEREFLEFIRITDSLQMHDTLTVTAQLVEDPHYFYRLGEQMVNKNFLKAPHEVRWLKDDCNSLFEFETRAPMWLNMSEPNSVAKWILYFLERAVFMQFQMNVHHCHLDCRDTNNQPLILNTDNKNIQIESELKPFWRNLCESVQSHKETPDEILARLKSRAMTVFDVQPEEEQAQISHLHGGLVVNDSNQSQSRQIQDQIDRYIDFLRQCIQNFGSSKNPQLDLSTLAKNTLQEASQMRDPNDAKVISQEFFISSLARCSIVSSSSGALAMIATQEHNLKMKLERIFIEVFREKITADLKSNFTSTNKKVQKRKIKKLKQREQQLEMEREQQRQQEDQQENVITVRNANAIQMLIQSADQDPHDVPESNQAQLQKTKNKKKKNSKAAKAEKAQPLTTTAKQTTSHQVLISKEPINPQNYFQVLNHNYALSLESQGQERISIQSDLSASRTTTLAIEAIEKISRQETANTKSTSNESKQEIPAEVKLQAEMATSNKEVVDLYQKYHVINLGNQHVRNTNWQRNQSGLNEMINELISESSHHSNPDQFADIIEVEVSNNQIVTDFDNNRSSGSSINSNKQIITFKKRQNQKIIPRQKPSSSDESSSNDTQIDLLPDLHTTTLHPRDNDSSDCEQDDEVLEEEDQSSITNSHSRQIQSKQFKTKPKQLQSGKKSIKSANPSKIPGKITLNPKEANIIAPEVIKHKWKPLKRIEAVTIQYIVKTKTLATEWKESKANKKSKKQRQQDWQNKFAQETEAIQPQNIEIIKPQVLEITKPAPVAIQPEPVIEKQKQTVAVTAPGAAKKSKPKKKDHVDAIEEFMKKMHKDPEPETVKVSKPMPSKEVEKPQKTAKTIQSEDKQPKQVNSTKQPEESKTVQRKNTVPTQTKERMSSVEEARLTSFEYKAKKASDKQNPEVPSPAATPSTDLIADKDIPKQSKSASKATDLNIQSKEFKAPAKNLMDILEPKVPETVEEVKEPAKKKKKKNRSNKNKKKQQAMQNNFFIDPLIGQQLLNLSNDQTYVDQSGFNPVQNFFIDNPQMQSLLQSLNEQVLAQQQRHLEEMKAREEQEAENQLLEDCQPCPEIDSDKYDLFFDQLEQEMHLKVKEIDQLKDSVRRERQGFIQIMESIVKDTFQYKYGNGFVGIKIFGSMATELAIETSDVDLVVTGINQVSTHQAGYREYQGKLQLLSMMQKLHDRLLDLKEDKKIQKIKFIQTATVPIIKLVVDLQVINEWQRETQLQKLMEEQEEEGGQIDLKNMGLEKKSIDSRVRYLQIDISIDESSEQFQTFEYSSFSRSHSGIETIYHIQQLVKQRKDLRPIVMIIKKIFDQTFLSMPYYGGVSSFSLVLMVSAYLKRFDANMQQSLSTNLSGFFHFYGVGFKPHLFYLNGDQIEFCEDPESRPCSDPFIVLDPLDTSNNISHSTFRFRDIQRALVKAFKIINKSCEQFQMEESTETARDHAPKRVLERLINEIKEEYMFDNGGFDDF